MYERIILNPDERDVKVHGILAHVDAKERARILSVGYGNFKSEVKAVQRDLAGKKKEIAAEKRHAREMNNTQPYRQRYVAPVPTVNDDESYED